MANFEAFVVSGIKLRINLLFLKSVVPVRVLSGLIIFPSPIVLYDEVEQRHVLLGIVSFGNR